MAEIFGFEELCINLSVPPALFLERSDSTSSEFSNPTFSSDGSEFSVDLDVPSIFNHPEWNFCDDLVASPVPVSPSPLGKVVSCKPSNPSPITAVSKRQSKKKLMNRPNSRARGSAFSSTQTSVLTAIFLANVRFPKHDQIVNISKFTGLDTLRVKSWFQNARVRGMPTKTYTHDVKTPVADILSGAALEDKKSPTDVATPASSGATSSVPSVEAGVSCSFLPDDIIALYEQNKALFDQALGHIQPVDA
ncbi:Homeobox domain [Carpediemonas membranifera]|uniref:Homeobox domain n=1 Tax=Carpediemonas membranifera TaxID=201153 RepID=A0A8J6AVQ4_9EUKA|nr:Homeobox domain [Carpediemonas membranifera]|eukprot:KAG9393710.1 Homeobox domain [Carpediemonas membranifera]